MKGPEGEGGQHHAPAALPPGKIQYPLYKGLGGPQGRSGQVQKISSPPGFFFSMSKAFIINPVVQLNINIINFHTLS
jgi:hypothetical protein